MEEPRELEEFPDEESDEAEEEWDDIRDVFYESRKAGVPEKLTLRTFVAYSFQALKQAS